MPRMMVTMIDPQDATQLPKQVCVNTRFLVCASKVKLAKRLEETTLLVFATGLQVHCRELPEVFRSPEKSEL